MFRMASRQSQTRGLASQANHPRMRLRGVGPSVPRKSSPLSLSSLIRLVISSKLTTAYRQRSTNSPHASRLRRSKTPTPTVLRRPSSAPMYPHARRPSRQAATIVPRLSARASATASPARATASSLTVAALSAATPRSHHARLTTARTTMYPARPVAKVLSSAIERFAPIAGVIKSRAFDDPKAYTAVIHYESQHPSAGAGLLQSGPHVAESSAPASRLCRNTVRTCILGPIRTRTIKGRREELSCEEEWNGVGWNWWLQSRDPSAPICRLGMFPFVRITRKTFYSTQDGQFCYCVPSIDRNLRIYAYTSYCSSIASCDSHVTRDFIDEQRLDYRHLDTVLYPALHM
jgi:hypothetical protein